MGRVTNLLALRADHRHGEPPKNQRLNYLQGVRVPSTATVDVRARVWVDVWVRVYLRRAGLYTCKWVFCSTVVRSCSWTSGNNFLVFLVARGIHLLVWDTLAQAGGFFVKCCFETEITTEK